ncbi:hypothetical protein KFE25_011266 [Diacronema lutheri]|uniref:Uncharacterized protein n=1 Tax=Diacronema lutheri TaxID=2081491 RepID=A0A8J5X3H7_DIALT|nr:hypothetical protein KFE25_011266 [Diacronema lutheri]
MKGVAMRAARDVPRERPEALSRALDELRTGNELLATRVDELHALALGSHAAAVRARGCVLTTCAARARAAGAAGALRAWWLAARALCALYDARTAVLARLLARAALPPAGALEVWADGARAFARDARALAAARGEALERVAHVLAAGRLVRACNLWRYAAAALRATADERAAELARARASSGARAAALRGALGALWGERGAAAVAAAVAMADAGGAALSGQPLVLAADEDDEPDGRVVVLSEARALALGSALAMRAHAERLAARVFRAWADMATLRLADRERAVSRELKVSVYVLYEACRQLHAEAQLRATSGDAAVARSMASKLIAQRRADSSATSALLGSLSAQEAAVRRLAGAALRAQHRGAAGAANAACGMQPCATTCHGWPGGAGPGSGPGRRACAHETSGGHAVPSAFPLAPSAEGAPALGRAARAADSAGGATAYRSFRRSVVPRSPPAAPPR